MRSVKEQYWRYSLFVIILVLGVVIFAELTPYIGGLLGAMTIYVLLRRQMRYLTVRRRWRRSLAASVLLVEAIVCFLIPLSGIVWMFVDKVQDFTLDPQSLISSIRHVSEQIRLRIGYDLLQDSNISSMVAVITRFGQAFLQGIFSFGVNIVMLLFVLYFMLIGGTRMENYCRAMLPFNATVARNVTNEIYMIVRSNAIGIPLIAVVQGSIAYAGYLVCGVPSALFWGVVTCFATILPVVGTALVWVPLAAYLAVEGSWGAAVGLMAYGVLVVTQSDNVIRFILQKRMADTHPLVTILGVLIGMVFFIAGLSALLDRFARYHFKRMTTGVFLLLQIAIVTCCGMPYLLKFPTFYSLPIMLALAFSVWGLYFWMVGRSHKRPEGFYLAGSLCMALVVGCRPQLVLLSFLAFPLFWRMYITEGRIRTVAGARQFACLIAPYIVVCAGIMWYNKARFGSLFDFGANYNLTVNDMTKRGMAVGRIAPALFAYLFQTPATTGVFPYLQAVAFETTYLGQTVKEVTFGGIFAVLPILWVLPFARRILQMRINQRKTRTVAGVIGVLIGIGVLIAVADAEMAGILQRYFADFSIMFLMAAVLLLFIVNENIENGSKAHAVFVSVLPVAVAVGVAYTVLLCITAETGWVSDAYPWAYQGLLETFQFWT